MKTLIQILILSSSLSASADWVLEVKIEQVAETYSLDAQTFRALLVTESNLKLSAVNHKTLDYGIGQINIKTINALGLDKERLLLDIDYSLNESAKLLHAFCRRNARECVGRYNVGTGPLTGLRAQKYEQYTKKVLGNKQKRSIASRKVGQ